MPRGRRSNSVTPRRASSLWMLLVSAGCVTARRPAAALTLPSRATARKCRSNAASRRIAISIGYALRQKINFQLWRRGSIMSTSIGGELVPYAHHIRPLRFADPQRPRMLRRHLDQDAELRSLRTARGHLRHAFRRQPPLPARRDLHTGRLNFMHRSWGPLEPFDNSFPEMMRDAGIHTHLVTDHMHYFEDGGATYHGRFRTWDFIRGQEYDPWKAMVDPPLKRLREKFAAKHYNFDDGWKRLQHAVNCEFMEDEQDFCLPRCFASGFEFLDINR